MLFGLFIAFLVIVFDQISKYLILNYVSFADGYVSVFSFFNIVKAWNTGVSFSMFDDLGTKGPYILNAVAFVIVVFLFSWIKLEKSKYMLIALGMVIGGAIGNMIDRFMYGAVFDFLDVYFGTYHWPAFNVADSFICIGTTMIIINELFMKRKVK